eukprot:CAMPEP_0181177862 /NCGR_PEP_ID=MMETSP1096-20121128/5403_1 /TAXON_ID=156174 ORGANISM="Chrysochromulina ericina, Strain CCMP281" /NCGR_SAMPLE_ID=MMETSP1096 /ASSEMBLY_ACC=CAM_ASM_000453 /LENGTH=194 /DNA_ID=CAMNT_0023266073 /DNA_START=197 /DNA_END=782 /DNA_ORIENTATION=-
MRCTSHDIVNVWQHKRSAAQYHLARPVSSPVPGVAPVFHVGMHNVGFHRQRSRLLHGDGLVREHDGPGVCQSDEDSAAHNLRQGFFLNTPSQSYDHQWEQRRVQEGHQQVIVRPRATIPSLGGCLGIKRLPLVRAHRVPVAHFGGLDVVGACYPAIGPDDVKAVRLHRFPKQHHSNGGADSDELPVDARVYQAL